MKGDARKRWWRRKKWLLLLGLTVVVYPLLLIVSSDFGSSVGLGRDVNASRALARALSYAADPGLPVVSGNDGQLTTPALDGKLVALQLTDSGPGANGSSQASAGVPGSPSSIPGNGNNAPASGGGGGSGQSALVPAASPSAGGQTPASAPPPVAQPPTVTKPPAAPPPTAPPVAPGPSAAPKPTPTPTPIALCPPPTAGSGTFQGDVSDAQDKLLPGAIVQLFYGKDQSCLMAVAVADGSGHFVISGLAKKTEYNYIASAPTSNPGAGQPYADKFKTDKKTGDYTAKKPIQLQ